MKRWFLGPTRFLLVTAGIIALTSFTIDATELLNGSQSALGILAKRATEGACPAGMVRVQGPDSTFCIDVYEASPGPNCEFTEPASISDTVANSNTPSCIPVSEAKSLPWTYVAVHQAATLCARAGKRLPTAAEWYTASLGTPDSSAACNTDGQKRETGINAECRSGVGVFDMIGNVWELVDGSVEDGVMEGSTLPEEGYVERIDERGLASMTTTTPQDMYNQDYFWSLSVGTYAVMRGGFYGSKADAGIYSTHAGIDQNFTSAAIGFRCAQSV